MTEASTIGPETLNLSEHFEGLPRIPLSTYRLQLRREFGFRAAAELVPYLARLGVGAVYCSPYLQARPGSPHGYDICDHQHLNVELGTEDDYQAFIDAMKAHDLGHVLDIVPNHMGADPMKNEWWRDVLENGQASAYASFFDVEWNPVKVELKGKVLLPILGDHYGMVLDRGELQLEFEDGVLLLRIGDVRLPIDPRHWPLVFRHGLEELQSRMGETELALLEFLSILTALDHLPPTTQVSAQSTAERKREREVARERLRKVVEAAASIGEHIQNCLTYFNGIPGQSNSFDPLHELLERLPYRLAFWKTAFHEINYRRFFDINELAGLRMEANEVFSAAHALVLNLVRERKISGLRLDHPDGLFDPGAYAEQLQEAAFLVQAREQSPTAEVTVLQEYRHHSVQDGVRRPLYVVAEKILEGREALPQEWPLHGTSGYDFLNSLNRVFVDPTGLKPLRTVYEQVTGYQVRYPDLVYECKKLITSTALSSELNVLAHALNRLSEANRSTRDFTLESLQEALREVVACFPVYRTYVSGRGVSDEDRRTIETAVARAKRRNPATEPSIFNFVRTVLLSGPEADPQQLAFAMKFQQYTGPVQAKGVEDTAFYRYNLLVSLNEVGGDPLHFGGTPKQFHESNLRRLDQWPHAMLATATHDHKRGEDTRARLNVLSELPVEWGEQVTSWMERHTVHCTDIEGELAPDANDRYLFYQVLLGSWPAEAVGNTHQVAPAQLVERLTGYMTKATKEAKVHTSWIHPNADYDQAMVDFVQATLSGPGAEQFLADFRPFQRKIARAGMINALSQLLLKLVSPGVPDFYQGNELWDFSLVDPDNRRLIDYDVRKQMLDQLEPLLQATADLEAPFDRSAAISELLDSWEDGRIKLFLTAFGLRLRQQFRAVFEVGDYFPLESQGERANHILAFARRQGEHWILAIVPRLVAENMVQDNLPTGDTFWGDTRLVLPRELSPQSLVNRLSGEPISAQSHDGAMCLEVATVLKTCPFGVLTNR